MKKFGVLALVIVLVLLFSGCRQYFRSRTSGSGSTAQIKNIESCLSIDLDSLTDDFIKTIHTHADAEGNGLTVQYIDLDGGGGEFVLSTISSDNKWHVLPYDEDIQKLLRSSGADEHFAFESIENGYYIISGAAADEDGFDFDRNHFDEWHTCYIGIWDTFDETLYYISVTGK